MNRFKKNILVLVFILYLFVFIINKYKTSNNEFFIKNFDFNWTSITEKIINAYSTNITFERHPDLKEQPIEDIEKELSPLIRFGGFFRPKTGVSENNIAIIVPYRDRYEHLLIFLKNIHRFLIKQQIHYQIFIIEQSPGRLFNRGSLMNIGFLEALKMNPFDCFIFHDVDLLPLDDRNLYTCSDEPRHMSVAIDKLGFKLPYKSYFGGVTALTRKQFETLNGYSNSFFGWGGEDDDLSFRLNHANYTISRYPNNIARYMSLKHEETTPNNFNMLDILLNGPKFYKTDGLNSIKYDVFIFEMFPLYTSLVVDIKNEPMLKNLFN